VSKNGKVSWQEEHRFADGSSKFTTSTGLVKTRSADGLYSVQRGGRTVYSEHFSGQTYNGRPIINRSYSHYSTTLVSYHYYGGSYYVYRPSYFFAPSFYSFYWSPFVSPMAYTWGYPTYYYGYWQPMPVYPSLSFLLVDMLIYDEIQERQDRIIAEQQAQAAQSQAAAQLPPPAQSLTPQQQQQVRDLVNQQVNIAVKSIQSQQPMDPTTYIQPGRAFVANEMMSVSTTDGQTCEVNEGDVFKLVQAPTQDNPTALAVLLTSSDPSCRAGSQVTLSSQQLIEMQNNLGARVEKGLQKASTNPKIQQLQQN
jgi:hypothetical protein